MSAGTLIWSTRSTFAHAHESHSSEAIREAPATAYSHEHDFGANFTASYAASFTCFLPILGTWERLAPRHRTSGASKVTELLYLLFHCKSMTPGVTNIP